MTSPIQQVSSHISESEQILLKKSRDDKYDVLATMLLGEDGDTARRIQVDDTGSIITSSADLIETLQELIQRLAPIAGAMNSGAVGLRVVGVTMPSTAVTGPQTSAQFIATYNAAGVNYTTRVALENNTAIQSNVNNCTGV